MTLSSDTFRPFLDLPLEIRLLIWIFAVRPRLVTLRNSPAGDPRQTHLSPPTTHDPAAHPLPIFSTTPIPAPLHTCQESRQALRDFGYELTFGIENSAPLTWFNYRIDVLYLIKSQILKTEVWVDIDGGGRYEPRYADSTTSSQRAENNKPPAFDFKGLERQDLVRVERLALMDSSQLDNWRVPMFFDDTVGDGTKTSPELYDILLNFESLHELLIVERHIGNGRWDQEVPDTREEPWGYVQCQDIDVKARVWEPGRGLALFYYQHVQENAERNQGEWTGYFRKREGELESWLKRKRELAFLSSSSRPPSHIDRQPFGPGRPLQQKLSLSAKLPIKRIPNIRIVSAMTRLKANKLLLARNKYRLWVARERFMDEKEGVFKDGSEVEYQVIREHLEATRDEYWVG